jgi:hypothetical protein
MLREAAKGGALTETHWSVSVGVSQDQADWAKDAAQQKLEEDDGPAARRREDA